MTDLLRTPAAWPRILLERSTLADPTDLDAAVKAGAFAGLRRAVHELGPTATIAVVAASALRGRGGAGFPTGEKWRVAASQDADRRYVVANGYEADPATRTDRTLMERDPYAVVEGTAIAAWAIGATEALIAVRADATGAIRALEAAIGEAEAAGYLGADVLGTGRPLVIAVRPVQGAYLLGEETVLLKALEGKRGQPEQRPPYPAERGLFGAPTVVNNVATLAAVPWVLRNGPEAYASIGSTAAPGTVLVHVRGPLGEGIAEVPTGTPLRDLVGLVGGVARDRGLKALVIGGPSAGILPAELLDTPYEFAALRAVGAHVGSGAILVADDRACVVDLGRLLTPFCASEACGKTIPCRIGTRRLSEIGD
ncbi:MAG TPA: NADH-quinone oxidoreductase subunit L, partial [Candidatus Dormibacteraeota bacterium]|nr:NADH-quinone oxidoreductase subunit L [Candidatus Dormibacteraeota bacterium]